MDKEEVIKPMHVFEENASKGKDSPIPWCYGGKPYRKVAPPNNHSATSGSNKYYSEEAVATQLQKITPEQSDVSLANNVNVLAGREINCSSVAVNNSDVEENAFCAEAIESQCAVKSGTKCGVANSQVTHCNPACCCEVSDKKTSDLNRKLHSPVEKTKICRIPSIPALIVSDTSTGKNNCILESAYLPLCKEADELDGAVMYRSSLEGEMLNTADISNQSDLRADTDIIATEAKHQQTADLKSTDEHLILSPRRSCDSAYDSSVEPGMPTTDQGLSSTCDNDAAGDNISSGAASLSSAEDSPNHAVSATSLSVSLLRKNLSSPFSSSSSIASDSAAEGLANTDDSGSSGNLLLEKDSHVRRLSSSSSFSLRSSLSFEESEEDFVSGDDSSLHETLARRNSKAKAQSSWTKIRRMVIWSPFMQSFKKKYPWVQLAGHAGSFQPGDEGCILKKYVEREAECLKGLTSDPTLREFAPTFHGVVNMSDEKYTRMQDLLLPFDCPSLMDCKMGIRTYLEDELVKAKVKPRLRHDMYQKMVEISPDEPTEEERKQKAVTKPRYMQWREQVSSTSNLGFRIEGIKKSNKDPSKDYKLTKTVEQVTEAFKYFIDSNASVLEKYIERLKDMRATLETSDFFHSHEAIGSSLLFVHDETGLANVWMIDFGKTSRLPGNQRVDHRSEWKEGNREDGYMFGMDNMVRVFEEILDQLKSKENARTEPSLACDESSTPDDKVKSLVDITVTAPSPVNSRKQLLKRQVARANSDDCVIPHSDVTKNDVTS